MPKVDLLKQDSQAYFIHCLACAGYSAADEALICGISLYAMRAAMDPGARRLLFTCPHRCAGYSAAGEALNCDIWSIAVRAAVDLGADKLFCLTVPESQPFTLPAWVPVSDAEALLNRLVVQHQSWDDFQAPIVPHRRAPPALQLRACIGMPFAASSIPRIVRAMSGGEDERGCKR